MSGRPDTSRATSRGSTGAAPRIAIAARRPASERRRSLSPDPETAATRLLASVSDGVSRRLRMTSLARSGGGRSGWLRTARMPVFVNNVLYVF